MATVKQALEILKNLAPEEHYFNREYDNVGLIVGSYDDEVRRVLCCLDVTEAVLAEAVESGCNLIIAHHPMIFCPIKNVLASDVTGAKIIKAIKNGINIYAAHTNLDFVKDGINDFLASLLGLRNIKVLDPYIDSEQGFGRVGDLPNKMYATVLKAQLQNVLFDDYIRICGEPDSMVKRVAVINGGAGGDTKYVDMALSAGADCLITADVKHHVAVHARERGIVLIEPQHYTSEHIYISRLVQILKIEFKSNKVDLEILQSRMETNPRF